jgi:flagellar hook-associated protein 3 FlgL
MAYSGRVTDRSIHTQVLANLQRSIAKGGKIQEQLSSGKQINRPSDSPTGTVASMQLRGELRANQQYVRNADDGIGWLSTADTALSDASSVVARARTLVLQGLNAGANDEQSREAIAVEIDAIKDTLVGLANTKYLDRPIFGGTMVTDEMKPGPFTANGTYQGDQGEINRTVGGGIQVRVDVRGTKAFGENDDENQVFAVLTDISASLRAGDTDKLRTGLNRLDKSSDLLKSTLSEVGARYNRLTQMKQAAEDRVLAVTTQLSDVEDIDLPKTIMEMQLQQTSYQAALAASAKVIQPSLIDFLR